LPLTAGVPSTITVTDDYYFSVAVTQLSFNKYDKLHLDINVPESSGDQPYYLVFLRHDGIPSRTDYDLRRIDKLKFNYTFEVANTELKVNSTLYGWIVNQELSNMQMTLNAYFLTNCPGHPLCTGNGVCDTSNGQCKCNYGWRGNDCSAFLEPVEAQTWKSVALFFGGTVAGFMATALAGTVVVIFIIRRMSQASTPKVNMDYQQQM